MKIFLIMFILNNETDALFIELYMEYRNEMVTIATMILRDHQLAEDVVHEAYIKIMNSLPTILSVESAKRRSYIINIAKNQAIDEYRRRNRQSYVSFDSLEYELEDPIFETEEIKDLAICIKALPLKYKDLFYLKYLEDKTNDEIAKILGVNTETIYKRLQRGRILLLKELKKKGVWIR